MPEKALNLNKLADRLDIYVLWRKGSVIKALEAVGDVRIFHVPETMTTDFYRLFDAIPTRMKALLDEEQSVLKRLLDGMGELGYEFDEKKGWLNKEDG